MKLEDYEAFKQTIHSVERLYLDFGNAVTIEQWFKRGHVLNRDGNVVSVCFAPKVE